MAVCRIIARMPTSVSCTLRSLKPPMRRVMVAKAGMNATAVDMIGWCAVRSGGCISAKRMSERGCKRCRQ